MDELPQCRCCRVPIPPRWGMPRMRLRVCPVCDLCKEKHGHDLHAEIAQRWNAGTMEPFLAVAVSAFDDAWLCGKLEIDPATGSAWIVKNPKRWEVAIAWARVRKTKPTLNTVMEAALAPHLGTRIVIEDLRRDMHDAVLAFDPNLADVEVRITQDPNAIDGIDIQVYAKAPYSDVSERLDAANAKLGGELIEVPSDMWSRPRGQA